MKALLLAAGLGTRLRPLTLSRPKPLCLYFGQPILDLVYKQIQRIGIHNIAINTHYLAQDIEKHIVSRETIYLDAPKISFEPEILGTGGCLNPLRTWIGHSSILIYNADIIADIDLKSLVAFHENQNALATMVLLPQWREGTNPVHCDGSLVRKIGKDCGPKGTSPATFTGMHILSKSFIDRVPEEGFQHIIDTYDHVLQEGGHVGAFFHQGYWADLGNPKDYLDAHLDVLAMPERDEFLERLGVYSLVDRQTFHWDLKQQSVFLHQEQSFPAQQSFVFGPIQNPNHLSIQRAIVYPSTVITEHDQPVTSCILTPESRLNISE